MIRRRDYDNLQELEGKLFRTTVSYKDWPAGTLARCVRALSIAAELERNGVVISYPWRCVEPDSQND